MIWAAGRSTHLPATTTLLSSCHILTTGTAQTELLAWAGLTKAGGLWCFGCKGRGELSDCLAPTTIQMTPVGFFFRVPLCLWLTTLLQVGQNSGATICHISTFTSPTGTSNNFPSPRKAALFSSMLPVKGSSLSIS